MRAALLVNQIVPDPNVNLKDVLRLAHQAADAGADLALFPEAALTGLINNEDPTHDLCLGQPIPGPTVAALAQVAREHCIWLALGLLERADRSLYDAAILLSPAGHVALHYRRIHPGWHDLQADPSIYRQGTELPIAETPLGRLAFLICGDLFDDDLVRRVRALAPDWLLFPFARDFDDGTWDQARWDGEEAPAYAERVRLASVTTLMTNYLAGEGLPDDHSFGGAMVVAADGQITHRFPVGQSGMLWVDLRHG